MGINSPIPVRLQDECKKAAKIFRSFVDAGNHGLDKVIPREVLKHAAGFAIFTVVKAGFLFSARAGSGLVIAKLQDGSWSAPSAIGTGGVGFGGQLGAEMTDFLIVLNSATAVRTFMASGSMTLGGNVSVAVGPLGRNAEGSGTLSSKGRAAALYSYSKTKGLFGGISIEGSIIVERQDANRQAYGMDVTSKQLLSGGVERPYWADDLANVIRHSTGLPNGRDWIEDSGNRRNYDFQPSGGYDQDGWDNEKDRDEFDEDSYRSGSAAGRGSLPRSQSYNYAFNDNNGASFGISSVSSTNGERPQNRSRSGSLASMFKKDLMGNDATRPGMGRSRSATLSSPLPSFRNGTTGLSPFSRKKKHRKYPPENEEDPNSEPTSPFGDEYGEHASERDREVNPFDTHMARTQSSSSLDPELDLGGEVVSPWNNEKGLSPRRNTDSPLPSSNSHSGNRSRSSSNATQNVSANRSRSGSLATSNVRVSSPLANDMEDITDRVGRIRASSTASAIGSRLRSNTYGFDDVDSSRTARVPHDGQHSSSTSSPRMPEFSSSKSSPRFDFAVRKELLEGVDDGLPRAIALHTFEGQELGDLTMKKGDVIVVTKQGQSRDEWWTGKNAMTGKEGIFPANHVELTNVPASVAAKHNRFTAPAFDNLPDFDHA